MANKKNKEYEPCPMTSKDCAACSGGFCLALEDIDYAVDGCPFYKTAEQKAKEDEACLERLAERNRFDLILKFRSKKEAKKYGCK